MGALKTTLIILLVMYGFFLVGIFFKELFQAAQWDCARYTTVPTTWVDYSVKPTLIKEQATLVCIEQVRK